MVIYMKVLFIKQILNSYAVESISEKSDTVLVYKKGARLGKEFNKVKAVTLPVTRFGLQKLVRLFKPNNQTHFPRYFLGLKKTLNKERPDVIVTTELYEIVTWRCIQYAKKNKVPVYIFSETKAWPASLIPFCFLYISLWYIRRNLKHVKKIVVWTQDGKKWFSKNLPQADIVIIPAPVDTKHYSNVKRKKWIKNGTLRILMVARYIPLKRHYDLLQAVKQIKESGKKVHVSLIGPQGLGKQTVENEVNKLRLDHVVDFLTPLAPEDMPSIYRQHDVLVLPSNREAVGRVVPEAMACGVPTITSDAVGANTYVDENKTGYIFAAENTKDLTKKILQCFDKELLACMGNAARTHIQAIASKEVVKKKYQELFSSFE